MTDSARLRLPHAWVPPDKAVKRNPRIQDALSRAYDLARKGSDGTLRILRLTVAPTPAELCDAEVVVLVCEYATGEIGMFQGGADEAEDKWILIGKDQVRVVGEAIERAKSR